MAPITRGQRIVAMLTASDREIWSALDNNIPSYESTKGTSPTEQATAIEGYKIGCSPKPVAVVFPYKSPSDDEVEDPFVDSGSEYVPSPVTSDSDTQSDDPQFQNTPSTQYITEFNSHLVETNIDSSSKSRAIIEIGSSIDIVKTSAEFSKKISIIDQYVIPGTEGTSQSDIGTLISTAKEDDNDAELTNYSLMKFSNTGKYEDKEKEVQLSDFSEMYTDNGRNDLLNDSETNFISDSNPSINGNDDCIIPLPNLLTFQLNLSPREAENASVKTSKMKLTTTSKNALEHISEEVEEVVDDRREQTVKIDHAKKNNGKRVRDKVHSCYFCNNLYKNNLPRHYQRVHKSEIEVAQIFSITDLRKRRERLINLERCGDFYHNCEVLSLKKGELILARRPSLNELQFTAYNDYGPCPQCLGFMLKRHIWHHLKYSCNSNKNKHETDDENQNSNKRLVIAESTALINGILSRNISKEFITNIINKFKNDEISEVCKGDESTVRYGAFLYEKYSTTQSELIRQNMRQLARLIIEVRKICQKPIISLREILCPENFDMIILATKQLCLSHQQITGRPEFGIPSLALKLGYSLKKCVAIERGQALRRGDLTRNKKLLAFLALLEIEWSVRVSSNAKATLESRKLNATDLLPLTTDLLKLRNYLDITIQTTRTALHQSFTNSNWVNLASLTLVRIILFNKRRSGEAAKITMQQYATRPSWDNQGTEEMKNSLTQFERKLASDLTLVQVVGKRGRRVPIIISKEVKETMDMLILTRVKAGVQNENPYIFAIPGTSKSHMRGHDCVKKWCTEAQLQSPELITGTKLRKYIATVCQVFDLTENEQDWLARHLGHDIRVHREFYRLQENAVELTKVSRLLLAVDQGEAQKFSGMKLKDINIEDLPAIVEEPDDDREKEMRDDVSDGDDKLEPGDEVRSDSEHCSTNTTKQGNGASTKKLDKKRHNKRTCTKTPWSAEEKEIVLREMRLLIKKNNLPGKEICSNLLENYPALKNRKWTDIKFFVKNYLAKNKK